ncbi:MAG: two-component system response regulator [Kordiimonadales bacterium]|nr:MAG: two-component system response regulator [Kordiimonadales bacterium]
MKEKVLLLFVEDDEVDTMGLRRMMRKKKVANPFKVAVDGIEALEILRGENGHTKLLHPYVILLDLNLPRMSGLELLTEIRADRDLQDTAVFIMSTSEDQRDIQAAYDQGVGGYIVKTGAQETMTKALEMLDAHLISN